MEVGGAEEKGMPVFRMGEKEEKIYLTIIEVNNMSVTSGYSEKSGREDAN